MSEVATSIAVSTVRELVNLLLSGTDGKLQVRIYDSYGDLDKIVVEICPGKLDAAGEMTKPYVLISAKKDRQ